MWSERSAVSQPAKLGTVIEQVKSPPLHPSGKQTATLPLRSRHQLSATDYSLIYTFARAAAAATWAVAPNIPTLAVRVNWMMVRFPCVSEPFPLASQGLATLSDGLALSQCRAVWLPAAAGCSGQSRGCRLGSECGRGNKRFHTFAVAPSISWTRGDTARIACPVATLTRALTGTGYSSA